LVISFGRFYLLISTGRFYLLISSGRFYLLISHTGRYTLLQCCWQISTQVSQSTSCFRITFCTRTNIILAICPGKSTFAITLFCSTVTVCICTTIYRSTLRALFIDVHLRNFGTIGSGFIGKSRTRASSRNF